MFFSNRSGARSGKTGASASGASSSGAARLCAQVLGVFLLGSPLLLQAEALKTRESEGGQPGSDGLTLGAALQRTLDGNIELKRYPYYLRISDAQVLQAQVRPAPRLTLDVDNFAGDGVYQGDDRAEVTLTLGQTLELGGKRDSRVAFADAKTRRQQLDYQQARVDILAETSRRYYETLRLQRLHTLVQQRVKSEGSALEVIQQRARAGAVGQADVSKMRLRLLRSRALYDQLGSQQQSALMHLAAMWNVAPDFTRVLGDQSRLPDMPELDSWQTLLDDAPQVRLAQLQNRLGDAQLQLERANGRADLDLGVGLRRFETSGDQALVFSASMPLNFSNPNRGNIAAAEIRQQLSQEEQLWVKQQLLVSLNRLQKNLTTQHQYAVTLVETLLPQARKLLRDTEAGYRKGRYNVLQWADAQSELFDLERELIETRHRVLSQLLELERLSGQSLISKNDVSVPQQTHGEK